MAFNNQSHIVQVTPVSRRQFLFASGSLLAMSQLGGNVWASVAGDESTIKPAGPASNHKPKVMAAFVRRKEEYGMWWPGAIYDGEKAKTDYTQKLKQAAEEMDVQLQLRAQPIYSEAEADQWIAKAKEEKVDGLFVILLDRQQHSWPTAVKAIKSPIPSVIYSPIGSSFTTNTIKIAHREGSFISSTDDFSQAIYGLKMLKAGAKLRETRYIVLKGNQRVDREVKDLGTKLRYIPAKAFLDEYNSTPTSSEIRAIAQDYLKHATHVHGASEEDILNGVKSFVVARTILQREEGDAITMDCLGALGKSKVSLPCIAWSRMLDCGIPAACEADIGAAVTHALVQYLFDRPGFQQDPVAETARNCVIGAHCTCPTKLRGFDQPAEPYYLSHHHGNRDAVPRPMWKTGERVTVADVLLNNQKDKKHEMIISSGEVVDNVAVPPAGGCVVSVMVKLDGVEDVLAYPGFHQIFFYGDFKQELKAYCQLHRIDPMVV